MLLILMRRSMIGLPRACARYAMMSRSDQTSHGCSHWIMRHGYLCMSRVAFLLPSMASDYPDRASCLQPAHWLMTKGLSCLQTSRQHAPCMLQTLQVRPRHLAQVGSQHPARQPGPNPRECHTLKGVPQCLFLPTWQSALENACMNFTTLCLGVLP